MTLGQLGAAFFTYPAVWTYIAIALAGGTFALSTSSSWWLLALAFALAGVIYPLVWYVLHRFVLHGRYLYKSPLTARVWKRIHFDHHSDPYDLRVLFGALYTTLPTIAVFTMPLGWLVGGPAGAAAALSGGMVTTLFYEFCHCVQHLNHLPKWPFLHRIKRLHVAHHFHNETGNFGITNFAWDRVFGTFYARPKDVPRSATVFNLGYDEAEAVQFPWVARLTPPGEYLPSDGQHGQATGAAPRS